MKVSWRIGRILGIDIYIDASWLVIFGLLTWILASYYLPSGYPKWLPWQYWVVAALTSILFFGSVLGHELAHSLVAIKQGEKVRRITLFILGGVAQISEKPKEAAKEFFMSFVGPLASFAFAIIFYSLVVVLRPVSEPAAAIARYLSFINVLLGVFNLLKHRDRAFLVVDNSDFKRIVCLEDAKRIPRDQWPSVRVGQVMTARDDLAMVSPDNDGNKVLAQLTAKNVHQVPVVKDGKIQGIVCRTDILQFMQFRSDLGM